MTFIGVFLSALLGTMIVGAVARFVIKLFIVSHPARFGGFCVAFGFAIARYSHGVPFEGRILNAASAAFGAVIALIGLWYWLMAKPAATHDDELE